MLIDINRRKKIILIVIAVLVGVLLVLAGVWLYYVNTHFITYQDTQYKFSIKYPNTWRLVMRPLPNVAVSFLRPKDTKFDNLQENFCITIQPKPDDVLTLDAFSAVIKRQMSGVFGKTIKIVGDSSLQWGWRQGHILIIDEAKPAHIKLINAWTIRGDQVYILTYLGDSDKYLQDYLYVDEMIRSFQLLQE